MNFNNDPWVADIVQQFQMHADEEDLSQDDRLDLSSEIAGQLDQAAVEGEADR